MGPGDQAASEAAPPPGRLRGVLHPGRSIPRRAPRRSSRPVPVARADSGTRPSPGRGRARRRRAWRPRAAAQPALPLGRTVPGARGAEQSPAPPPRAAADRGRASARSSSAALAGAPPPRRRPHPPRPQEPLPRAPAARRPRAEVSLGRAAPRRVRASPHRLRPDEGRSLRCVPPPHL